MEFRMLPTREKIPEGFALTTVDQAKAQLQAVLQACSSSVQGGGVRLKNGVLLGDAASKIYEMELKYKLVSKPKSVEALAEEEDRLIALAYAAENDDMDEVEELVKLAGPNILSRKLSYVGSILHVCTRSGSIETLAKVLEKYPQNLNMDILDRYGDTALHNLPDYERGYEDCKRAACLLLRHSGNANKLLSVQSNYGGMTAVCKALMLQREEVCRALLDAGRELLPVQSNYGGMTAMCKALLDAGRDVIQWRVGEEPATPAAPEWLTLKAYDTFNNDKCSTALHLAVKWEYVDIVDRILAYPGAKGLNLISQMDEDGNTPLHIAAHIGKLDICLKLLQYSVDIKDGASANAQNKLGQTPLHIASILGHAEVCEKLLHHDACIHLKDNDGRYALTNAFHQGHKDAVCKLLDACLPKEPTRSSPTPLINEKLEFGFTPLHVAVAISSYKHISRLHKAGAFVDARNDDGETPLHVATQKYDVCAFFFNLFLDTGHEVKFCNHGMDQEKWINMTDLLGQTALNNLVRLAGCISGKSKSGDTDEIHRMVRTLLHGGALVDLKDCNGETPLHIAARECHKETVSILLKERCKYSQAGSNRCKWIAMCDFSGETALHEAAKKGRLEIVKLLLENTTGSSINDLLRVRDMENRTALHWAVKRGDGTIIGEMMGRADDITKRFLMWNVKEHIVPGFHDNLCKRYDVKEGQTSLLQVAVQARDLDIAREIINRGADVTSLPYGSRHWLSQNLGRKASDQPALEDNLGRIQLVEGVAALLLNPYTETPISIGIFGDWGTGKSSFMIQVEEALLCMAVKETFKNTPTQSHDQEYSVLKFSLYGEVVQAKVAKALNKRMAKADKENQRTCGVANPLNECMSETDIENQRTKEGDAIDNFPIKSQSEYHQLFKDLALTDRSKLVQSHGVCGKRKVGMHNQTLKDAQLVTGHTPAVLTVRYNAWQYNNKTEASAGLAVEISQQLENFMTPHQWLRMCWEYSWKNRPMDIFVQLLLPVLLGFIAFCVVFVLWKVAPITTKYKTFSLPVAILGVVWAFFKTFLRVVQPVAQTILNNISSPDHQSMLGYQQQVIGDIKFLKEQLCKEAHFGWKILGFLGQLVISKYYFMEGTWVCKQHPRLNNLRIVVFIDDLDRCDEKTVLELLRAVNLILGSCGISAVIGIDKGMVQGAITKEYLKDTGDKLLDILMENAGKKAVQEGKSSRGVENDNIKAVQEDKSSQLVENDKKAVQEDKSSQQAVENDKKEVQEEKCSTYARELADRYLQKIIQLPIQLPDPSTDNLKQFLQGQVGRRSTGRREEYGAFHLLLANYSPMESDMLIKLCGSATGDRKFPREWKRFLNYHRLAWTIIIQNKEYTEEDEFKGWQIKLILWIFVCWNWREQMDVVIENWQDLISKKQEDKHLHEKRKKNWARLALGDVIGLYMESKGWKTKEDIANIRQTQGGQVEKAWIELYNTLKEEYDIPMRFIERFQQFRFHCKLNHLKTDYKEIEEEEEEMWEDAITGEIEEDWEDAITGEIEEDWEDAGTERTEEEIEEIEEST